MNAWDREGRNLNDGETAEADYSGSSNKLREKG